MSHLFQTIDAGQEIAVRERMVQDKRARVHSYPIVLLQWGIGWIVLPPWKIG
jgi:hypothetical protein